MHNYVCTNLNIAVIRHGATVKWMLELLWPHLASNNDFFWDTRRDPHTDLVRLGSDPGFAGRCAGRCLKQDLQHARYESGLDNSPTLDGTDGQLDSAAAWYVTTLPPPSFFGGWLTRVLRLTRVQWWGAVLSVLSSR